MAFGQPAGETATAEYRMQHALLRHYIGGVRMHSVNGSFTNPHITFQAHQIGLYAKRQPAQPSREKVWRKRCNTLYTYTSFLVLRVGVPLCRRYACRYPLWAASESASHRLADTSRSERSPPVPRMLFIFMPDSRPYHDAEGPDQEIGTRETICVPDRGQVRQSAGGIAPFSYLRAQHTHIHTHTAYENNSN